MRTTRRIAAASIVVSGLTMVAACGGGSGAAGTVGASAPATSSAPSSPSGSASDDVTADPTGPGCAAYARAVPSGAGSVAGMATDPVAVAAGNNPLLTTLTAAFSGRLNPKVSLVDILNGAEFTVFAPVDSAFAKLPAATVKALGTPAGAATLRKVLTYHVVSGEMTPSDIAGRTLQTVEGENLRISGTADHLESQRAHVICGGVRTANATVYLIDSVMMPPSMK